MEGSGLAGSGWIAVESSWVQAVRFSPPDRLDVRTRKGALLPYRGCSEALFYMLLAAPSKGQYLNAAIKTTCVFLG